MASIKEELQKEIYQFCGQMMERADEILTLVENEEFKEASGKASEIYYKSGMVSQGLYGISLMPDEQRERDAEEVQAEQAIKSREAMESLLRRLLGGYDG